MCFTCRKVLGAGWRAARFLLEIAAWIEKDVIGDDAPHLPSEAAKHATHAKVLADELLEETKK